MRIVAVAFALSLPFIVEAQSNVTLYGALDEGVGYTSTGGTNPKTGKGASNTFQAASGGLRPNIWGLLGAEDLGGGWKAVFNLEAQYDISTGAAVGDGFTRRAFVGVAGPYGQLTLGRDWAPSFWMAYLQDINGYTLLGNTLSFWSGNGTRSNNGIFYNTPTWNGFMARTMISTGDWVAGQPRNEGKMLSLGLQYVGPTNGVKASAYYNHRTGGPLAASGGLIMFDGQVKSADDYGVGGQYQLGIVRFAASYNVIRPEDRINGLTMWSGGVGVKLFTIDELTIEANRLTRYVQSGETPRATVMSVSYVHPLSKRTSLYASAGTTRNNSAGTFALYSATSFWSPLSPGGSPRAVIVGLTHTF